MSILSVEASLREEVEDLQIEVAELTAEVERARAVTNAARAVARFIPGMPHHIDDCTCVPCNLRKALAAFDEGATVERGD